MMKTTVFGKCIIAGEHAVLRGVPALAVPVLTKSLELIYEPRTSADVAAGTEPIRAEFHGAHGSEMQTLFAGVMDRALEMAKRTRPEAAGLFRITNEVPVGAGLGASATLCVAVGRFFAYKGWVNEAELPEFCRQLENLFHGESSGLDIAVALSGQGVHFERGGARRPVKLTWAPNWYISYSGKRGVTSECINKVKALWAAQPESALRIDEEMRAAVSRAEAALQSLDEQLRIAELAAALEQAGTCFVDWGLADGEMGQHLELLRKGGAQAVKPTGSGDGGYALSLWKTEPPAALHLMKI